MKFYPPLPLTYLPSQQHLGKEFEFGPYLFLGGRLYSVAYIQKELRVSEQEAYISGGLHLGGLCSEFMVYIYLTKNGNTNDFLAHSGW